MTGSDADLCLFDKFHEGTVLPKFYVEALCRIGNIPQLNSPFHSEIEEQLHLKVDSDKRFLNVIAPITHICFVPY